MDSLIQLLLEKGFNVTPAFNTADYVRFDRTKPMSGWFKGWEVRDEHDKVLCCEARFGDWVTGEKHTWAGGQDTANFSPEKIAEIAALRAAAVEADRAAKLERQAEVAKEAERLFENAPYIHGNSHPYLARKKIIASPDIKLLGDKLCIPVFVRGEITSLQLIAADGSKKFLSGGRLDLGYCLVSVQGLGDRDTSAPLYMAEGYATAMSVAMAVNATVLVCFNTGNMVKLAHAFKDWSWYPGQFPRVVICADNDGATKGNPGMVAAHEARAALVAQGIECRIVAPQCSEGSSMDWNDFHVANGLEATRIALVGAQNDSESHSLAEVRSEDALTSSETPVPPSTRALLPQLTDFPQAKIRTTEKGKPIPPTQKQVVDLLLEGFGNLLMREGKEVFARIDSHWEEQDPVDFKFYIKRAVMRILHGTSTEKQTNDIYALFLGYLPTPPPGQSFYRQDPRLANFLDGTLEIVRDPGGSYSISFREHRREDLLTWVLPYEYKRAGGQNELFTSWLMKCFEGDPDANGKIRALKQVGGACLVSLFPRYVFLYGPGLTGKSTFAKLCLKFLSPKNVCSVEPKDQGGTFGKEILIGKQANIVTDISGAKIDSALFKRAEDRVPEYINRKNRGAIMGFLPALNIFCANPDQLPKGIDSESSAMNRRVTIVEFNRPVVDDAKDRKGGYEEMLLAAGPGAVLAFFLEGLDDLCQSGGVYFNPESGSQRLQSWKDSESMTAQFIDAIAHGEIDALRLDPEGKVERKVVGEAVATWAGRPLPTQAIGRLFSDLNGRGFRLAGSNGKRYVYGISSSVDGGGTRF